MNPYIYPGIGSLEVRRQVENKERLKKVGYTKTAILKACLRVFSADLGRELTEEVVMSRTRKREVVEVRQCAMYLMSLKTKMPLKAIGRFFKGRDHSTVIHSKDTWENLIATDKRIRSITEEVLAEIRGINMKNEIDDLYNK